MKLSLETFLGSRHKGLTLLGMSGVGKTTLANKLPKSEWFHYSGDYRIGTQYLEEPILDNVKRQAMTVGFLRDLLRSDSIYIRSNITIHNLDPISTFLGKIGNPALGGLPVDEFKRRQALHRAAEVGAMRDVVEFVHKAQDIYGYDHFVNDAGGSICELEEEVIRALAEHTLIVYIRADEAMEAELIRRQQRAPKPLYYDPAFLDGQLERFLDERGLAHADEIDPDPFVQWIFPRLVEHRRPLYDAIAGKYGYTIEARDVELVRDQQDLLDLLSRAKTHRPRR